MPGVLEFTQDTKRTRQIGRPNDEIGHARRAENGF